MDDTHSFDNEDSQVNLVDKAKKYIPKVKKRTDIRDKNVVNLPVFIIITILYIAVLVLGILSLFNVNVIWDAFFQNKIGGLWFVVLSASYLMFFFEVAPFNIKKKVRIALFVLSTISYSAIQVIPVMYLINNQAIFQSIKKIGMWNVFDAFVFSLITIGASYLSTMLIYVVPWFSYNFDRVEEYKELDFETGGIAKTILYFFLNILIAIYRFFLLVPKLRESSINTYFVVILPLSIILMPFGAETIAIILIVTLILFFVSLIEGVFFGGVSYGSSSITVVDQYGNEITLYECGSSYKDDAGNYYSENADGTYSQD